MKVAILSGDIINSSNFNSVKWQNRLKAILSMYGKEYTDWEISRGNFFQLKVSVQKAIIVALHIKAGIKELSNQLDVRMSIGIGEQKHKRKKISLSAGEAYILSSRGFDELKKQSLMIFTRHEKINDILNTMLALALIPMNRWTMIEAKTFLAKRTNPNLNLKQLSKKLKKSSSTISETLKRAAYEELMLMEKIYQKMIGL